MHPATICPLAMTWPCHRGLFHERHQGQVGGHERQPLNESPMWAGHGEGGHGCDFHGGTTGLCSVVSDLGGNMAQCRSTNPAGVGGGWSLAVANPTIVVLRRAESGSSLAFVDVVVLSVDAPFSYAPSVWFVEGIRSRRGPLGRLLFLRLDVRFRRVCLWGLPCGCRLDMGEHLMVAVPPATVPPCDLAHLRSEHWRTWRLSHHVRPRGLIMRCTIRSRWGNHLSVHLRNSA